MLKAVHRVTCSPALAACQQLMQRFARWMCDPGTTEANLTRLGLLPPVMPSAIEADWLWKFLQRVEAGQPLLDSARVLVAMPVAQKAALAAWVQTVSGLSTQFQPAPAAWPTARPLTEKANWAAFKTVMEAFYDKAFSAGLPYLADGTPAASGGVTYSDFVGAFRDRHRLNPDPHAREVCVFCGGHLGYTPHVDHWIIKSAFPLLSMCRDNLTLICSTCNEAPNKGDKAVYSAGSFADWFHPYLRPGTGALQLGYDFHTAAVHCSAVAGADQPKVANLDRLLNGAKRWTREFKAEYARHQDALRRSESRRLRAGQARHTLQELGTYVHRWAGELSPSEPHHEVHTLLGQALSEPARLQAWLAELAKVQ